MKYITYSNKIVLMWAYDEKINGKRHIVLNGQEIGKTSSYHFIIDNLEYNTTFKVDVLVNKVIVDSITILTMPKKNVIRVDVDNRGIEVVTKDIQKIIDSANENDVIYFPEGIYLTGALFFKSNHEIYLDERCLIKGNTDHQDYLPKIKSRFEGIENESYASLFNFGDLDRGNIHNTHNIIIHGKGTIIGGGLALHDSIIEAELPFAKDDSSYRKDLLAGRARGRLINISNCDNVIVDGIKMGYSPSWNLHITYSSNIYIHSCKFESFGIHNGDGIDIDSCENSYIFNNVFNTGDDCIAIKSGKNPEGNIINIPTKNVNIFDCDTIKGHACALGSEISGGIEDINIYNCDFTNTIYGLHIKSTLKRGGYIKNVKVRDSKFSSINIRGVPYNDDGESASTISEFKDFEFGNITLSGIMYEKHNKTDTCKHINVDGFINYPDNFNNFKFNNITLLENYIEDKTYVTNAVNVTLDNMLIKEK